MDITDAVALQIGRLTLQTLELQARNDDLQRQLDALKPKPESS